jgi:uncharacterized coiled-coil protein SlyX
VHLYRVFQTINEAASAKICNPSPYLDKVTRGLRGNLDLMSQFTMNSRMQSLPSANAPQNPTNYIVDTVSGQHRFILENLTNLFNERFASINGMCETILKQQNILYNNHQSLAAGLQEMRTRQEDNHNQVISTLNERLPQLETSLATVSKNMDLLARGLRQIDGKVVPLAETTREMELTVREIYESVKDPRAFGTSTPLCRLYVLNIA